MDDFELGSDQGSEIAGQVRIERLQLLFRQSGAAVFGSYMAAVILCWLCWDRFDHAVVAGWIALLTASTLLRILMFIGYFRSPISERTPKRWERRYWCTLVLSAGVWGAGALAVIPAEDLLAQAMVMLFTVGMFVSAVSCYTAYRNMTMVSIGLVLMPCSTWLLFQSSTFQVGMALAVFVFASFVASATRKMSEALETAFRLARELERENRLSVRAARTDELTGLKNRRAFFDDAHQLFRECKSQGSALCAVMLDMDHFKHINDSYGHQVGDQVLRQVGAVITASVRETDVHGRLGGEEFAILLPHTKLDVALSIAQELIQAIARLEAEPAERITASLGLASLDYTDESLYTLMNNADRALYKAKSYGRNQVAVAE